MGAGGKGCDKWRTSGTSQCVSATFLVCHIYNYYISNLHCTVCMNILQVRSTLLPEKIPHHCCCWWSILSSRSTYVSRSFCKVHTLTQDGNIQAIALTVWVKVFLGTQPIKHTQGLLYIKRTQSVTDPSPPLPHSWEAPSVSCSCAQAARTDSMNYSHGCIQHQHTHTNTSTPFYTLPDFGVAGELISGAELFDLNCVGVEAIQLLYCDV